MKGPYVHRLDKLSLRQRAALACVCIEHVVDLYRKGEYAYAISGASKELRALGCAITEHLLDIYRAGNLKYRVRDIPGLPNDLRPDDDAVELGLKTAWRFVTDGVREPAIAKPILDVLKARPFISQSETISVPSNGPTYGLIDTLITIDDETDRGVVAIVSRASACVARLCMDQDDRDEQPTIEKRHEEQWQYRLVDRLVTHGDAPIRRETIADRIAEPLPWRRYLEGFRAKWSAIAQNR